MTPSAPPSPCALRPSFRVLQLRRLLAAAGVLVASLTHAQDIEPCLRQLRPDALAYGISGAAYDKLTLGLQADMSVVGLLDAQPEFVTPIWDYMASLVDEERVADGKAMLAQWAEVLARVEAAFGVDAATVVAVWGVESNYGRNFGSRPLLTSLATLSCNGRRQPFFRQELFATMKIVEEGHVAPERLNGSWAGAFGHTQFMPTTYRRLAVDFDGDGRRDLVDSVPDALASTANFLRKAGWQSGVPWGYEVRLPAGFDASAAGRKNKRPLAEWAAKGVTRIDGTALAGGGNAAVLLPAGINGPAFLVTRNFDAIYSYNAAESYALAIAHLSDRLGGGAPFVRPWPTDDAGLSRAERRELQQLLIARGHDIGEPDGMIGARSREALRKVQEELGMEPDGRAGQRVLRALRQSPR